MYAVSRFPFSSLVFVAVLLVGAGCSNRDKLYPVQGKVSLRDTPLTGGAITFAPDAAKGNTSRAMPLGQIGSDGTYSVSTDGKAGAPPGWYKVTVMTNMPGAPASAVKIDPRYADPAKTDLAVEVVANPSPEQYAIKIPR